jgi:hypothetical protein
MFKRRTDSGERRRSAPEYLVSMNFTGEIDVSREPLAKSTPANDVYRIRDVSAMCLPKARLTQR